jgi:plastocyanin
MKAFIIGLVAVIVIGGGGYLVLHKPPSQTSTMKSSQSPSSGSTENQNALSTIAYDGKNFSPATLTVVSGTTVTIKNTSSEDLQFNSNPHPVHTDDPDLNVGVVSPGQSKTFTVTMKGTFGYHNHMNPSEQGMITIK